MAIFRFDATLPFPSIYTAAPVGGAALIILFAADTTWIARLLSLRLFVGIGLVSYSTYLWHQPLFAFARLRSIGEPDQFLMAALAAAALVLGWATWRFVEQPFRRRPVPLLPTRRMVFGASATGIALIGSIGLAGYIGDGLDWRLDDGVRRYSREDIPHAPQTLPCALSAGSAVSYPDAACRFPDSAGKVEVLLAGDSHAAALSEVVGSDLRASDIGFYHASYSGCLALGGLQAYGVISDSDCQTYVTRLYDYAEKAGIQTLVLAGRFPWYLQGTRFNNEEGGVEAGAPGWYDLVEYPDSLAKDDARRDRVLAAYEAGIRRLAQRFNIVLVYPVPEAGWDVPAAAFRQSFIAGVETPVTTSFAVYKRRNRAINDLFDRLAAELPNVQAARVYEALCSDDTGRCVNADAKGVYYFDDDHLSTAGVRLVAPVILSAVRSAMERLPD